MMVKPHFTRHAFEYSVAYVAAKPNFPNVPCCLSHCFWQEPGSPQHTRPVRKAKEAAPDPNFWWLSWYPLPYKAFNWKQRMDSNLFKMCPSSGIHWIEPKTQDLSSLEKYNIRGDRAQGGKTHRNAEVCKMAPTYCMRFGKSQKSCSQTHSAWSLSWFDIVAGDVLALRVY